MAATGVTIKAAWYEPDGTNAYTGVDADTEITYTISADSGSDQVDDVTFTDTFTGGGLALAPAANGTYSAGCGSDPTDNGTSGATSVTVSDLTIGTSASCTVSFEVTGTQSGTVTDDIADYSGTDDATSDSLDSSQFTITAPDPALEVLAEPTVSSTAPKQGASYAYGQPVKADYACAEAGLANAINSCSGFDDFFNEIDPGDYLDTLDAGRDDLTVYAGNIAGGLNTVDIPYRVKPFPVTKVTSSKKLPVGYRVKLPIAGKLVGTALAGRKTVATVTTKVKRAGTVKQALKLTKAGRKAVEKAGKKGFKVKLKISFTPSAAAVNASRYFDDLSPGASTVTKQGVKLK